MSRSNYLFLIVQLYITFCLISADIIDTEWDLPTQKELFKYLSAVKNAVDFYVEYKDQVNIHLVFGLFVTNVNLGHALQLKWRTVPENIKHEIIYIIHKNNEILSVYNFKQSMIQSNKSDDENSTMMRILTLMNNASLWVENMEQFVFTMEKQLTPDQIREIYSPFNFYLKKVDNFYKWFPSPAQSDSCLVSLSKNPRNLKSSAPRCSVDDLCYDMLKRGTNFGYSLTHRIIFLLMARFGRGCSVFSEQEDKALIKRFCSTAHGEAAYIVDNNYGLVDLLMEIIAVCTIDGQSQFLKRTWLDNILKFQTSDGCFGALPVKKVKHTGRSFFMKTGKYFNILQDGCSPHTTGLATSTLSAAVRFIIEEYY